MAKKEKTESPTSSSATPNASTSSASGTGGAQNTTQADRSGTVGGIDTGSTGTLSTRPGAFSTNETHWSFTKKHYFFSHAWAKRLINKGTETNPLVYMSTGMCGIPLDFPVLYISPQEWGHLPPNTYALGATVTLKCYNARTSFQTNSSDTNTATMNNQLYLNFAKDVMKQWPGILVTNTGSSTSPVLTTDITSITEADWGKLTDLIYGVADLKTAPLIPPGVCGTWVEWPFSVAYGLSRCKSGSNNTVTDSGFIPLENAYAKMIAINNHNSVMHTWNINFHKSLITTQSDAEGPATIGNVNPQIQFGRDVFRSLGDMVVTNGYNTITPNTSTSLAMTKASGVKDYNQSMFRPMYHGIRGHPVTRDLDPPPVIGFGLEEIVAMTASNDVFQYQEGQVFFGLDTELHLISEYPVTGTRGPTRKWYTNNIYSYDATEYSTIPDYGQGYLYGKPWA